MLTGRRPLIGVKGTASESFGDSDWWRDDSDAPMPAMERRHSVAGAGVVARGAPRFAVSPAGADLQVGHHVEMSAVRRQQLGTFLQCRCGDQEIHRGGAGRSSLDVDQRDTVAMREGLVRRDQRERLNDARDLRPFAGRVDRARRAGFQLAQRGTTRGPAAPRRVRSARPTRGPELGESAPAIGPPETTCGGESQAIGRR